MAASLTRRLLRRVLDRLLPHEHRAIVLADVDADGTTWQVLASIPAACRLRLRHLRQGLAGDLQQGLRVLRRRPGLTAGITLTITLGVTATNAVATVAHAVLLRPLPYPGADAIVSIREIDRTGAATGPNLSWPDFLAFRDRATTLSAIAGFNGGSRTLQLDDGRVERISIASVTGAFFDVLGVTPALGRAFTDADTIDSAPPVVMVTHGAWRTRFGADPAIIGRLITVNTVRMEVVGVLPEDFAFAPRGLSELWLPLRPTAAQRERQFFHWMQGIARLAPGVTLAQAEADLDGIARTFAATDPKFHATSGVQLATLRDRLVGDVTPILLLLLAAAVLVLLVASANVAGLMLSSGTTRRGEMAVRQALGAARWRLTRQLVIENLVLTLPGIACGLVAGFVTMRAFVLALPRGTRASLPHLDQLALDPTAVLLTLGCVLTVVLVTGLLPAWRTAADARLAGRGVVGRGSRAHWVLVGAQVALAVTLLGGAGLMVQSLRRLLDVSPGFRPEGLLTFTLSLSGPRYETPEAVSGFFERVTTELSALPGVEGASYINQLPLTGAGDNGSFTTIDEPSHAAQFTLLRSVHGGYFDVMGIPLTAGRRLMATDTPTSPRVVLVNQLLADMRFAGQALDQRIVFPFAGPEPFTIVGVVGNERFDEADRPLQPVVYFADSQSPSGAQSLVVRTSGPPMAVLPAVRAHLAALDPGLPVFGVTTMEALADESDAVFRRRVVMTLLLGFAVVSVVLAAVGVYGVLAQLVADRRREIGVRVALGAGAAAVSAAVLRPGVIAAGLGLGAGLAGSLLVGRALGALLYGTAPADVATLTTVIGVTAVAVTLAALAPVRRALRIDPNEALRDAT